MLCDAAHGKLINVRTENVEHEFVNTHWERLRTRFEIAAKRWNRSLPGAERLCDCLVSVLRDLETGLEIALYEAAVIHNFGGPERVESDVPVQFAGQHLGSQRMRLIAPGVSFKITRDLKVN